MEEPLAISADELTNSRWIDVLDIREAEERRVLGFVPGSLRVYANELDNLLSGARTSSTVALVCNSGRRAREVLAGATLPQDVSAAYLEGGVLRWKELGFPCVDDDVPVTIPPAYLDVQIRSAQQFVSLLRSCFVAELIEGPLSQASDADIDPIKVFENAVSAAGAPATDHRGVERIIDHLAAASRRLGGSLDRIAENTSVMRALLDQAKLG